MRPYSISRVLSYDIMHQGLYVLEVTVRQICCACDDEHTLTTFGSLVHTARVDSGAFSSGKRPPPTHTPVLFKEDDVEKNRRRIMYVSRSP